MRNEHWFRYKDPTYKEVKRFTVHPDGKVTAVSYWVDSIHGRYNETVDYYKHFQLPTGENAWKAISPEEGMILAAQWKLAGK